MNFRFRLVLECEPTPTAGGWWKFKKANNLSSSRTPFLNTVPIFFLIDMSSAQVGEYVVAKGRHKGMQLSQVPKGYLQWAVNWVNGPARGPHGREDFDLGDYDRVPPEWVFELAGHAAPLLTAQKKARTDARKASEEAKANRRQELLDALSDGEKNVLEALDRSTLEETAFVFKMGPKGRDEDGPEDMDKGQLVALVALQFPRVKAGIEIQRWNQRLAAAVMDQCTSDDFFVRKTYEKAADAIRRTGSRKAIASREDAVRLKGVGKKIADAVHCAVQTWGEPPQPVSRPKKPKVKRSALDRLKAEAEQIITGKRSRQSRS